MVKAAQLAFEEAGYLVAGKKIEIIVEDDASKAEVAIDKARKLVEQDKVALIIGPTSGGNQMAVSSYMAKVGVINIHTNPSPVGVFMQKHPWTIQAGGAEPQLPTSMGRYAYEQLGYKKVTIITADWAPGHGFLDAFMKTFKKLGGEVVQEQYPAYGSADFGSYLAAMKDADACVSWFEGAMATNFLSQYEEFGLGKKMPLIGAFHGTFIAPTAVKNLPAKAAESMIGEWLLLPIPQCLISG